ncbi:MAG: DNA-processing protein DprA, partial [Patescibacteria group bacterium]|nr:DNA-processing protein DprA [Patescibacteria group bacterium]
AWNASSKDLKLLVGESLTTKFEEFKKKFSVKKYSDKLKSKKVSFLVLTDKEYPKLLKQIKNPPFLIYFKGDIKTFKNEKTIGIVGTRKITQYGKEVTEQFTEKLVDANFTIISGLAFGVDAVSHKTAIESNGKTIAVLGSGVDLCFPLSNKAIYNSIVEKYGAVVSEFPIGEPPSKGSFPRRNRIIAGLSQGVLVTEGAEDSGALLTADYAFEFKRKVFAVPGPITSNLSKGPYKLIQRGAKLVTSIDDILSELKVQIPRFKNYDLRFKKGDTEEENKILQLLQNENLGFDQIVRKTKIDPSRLGSILSMMEIKGFITNLNNGAYSIIS